MIATLETAESSARLKTKFRPLRGPRAGAFCCWPPPRGVEWMLRHAKGRRVSRKWKRLVNASRQSGALEAPPKTGAPTDAPNNRQGDTLNQLRETNMGAFDWRLGAF